MDFRYLQLAFPVLVALHNADEAIGMEKWKRESNFWFGGMQPVVFRSAAVALTLLALIMSVLSAVCGQRTLWANLAFGYMVAMLLNALVPHIAVSVAKRRLMPGLITAAFLNLPVLSYLVALALQQGYVSLIDAVKFSIAVPIFLLLTIAGFSGVAKVFSS